MKAMELVDFGGPEALRETEVADPVPVAGEVVIRVKSTSINMLDLLVRKGYVKQLVKLPHVSGSDVCGRIESVGTGVEGFGIEDVVMANPFIPCKSCEACLSNNESICYKWKIIGRDTWGSYGELVKLPASLLVKAPTNLNVEELGCIPLSLSSAWKCIKLAEPKEADTVIIRGASGNVGIFATMIAKAKGLKVIALTRSADKAAKLRSLNADIVINTDGKEQDLVKEIKDITNGNGADFLLEPFGSTLDQSLDMVHNGGKIILFGTMTGSQANVDVKKIYFGFKHIIGNTASSKTDFEDSLKFIGANNIKPLIGKRMSIKNVAEGQQMLENSEVFGKIVLTHDW